MPNRVPLPAALALLLLAAPAPAQDIVVPRWAAGLEAPGRSQFPWGIHQLRYQQVFDRAALALTGPFTIRRLAYRADGGSANIGHPITADLELKLCTTGSSSPALSTTFAVNLGPDLTTVLSRQALKLDGFTAPPAAPAPFTIRVALQKPFPLKPGANLLLEGRIWGNQGGQWTNWDFSSWMDAADQTKGPLTYFGRSCPGTAGWPAVTATDAQVDHRATVELWSAPVGANTLCLFSPNRNYLGPIGLPFPLDGIGAPGCWLHVEPLVPVPARVEANKLARASLALPLDIHLAGKKLYAQYLVLDPGANPAGLTASGAVEMELAAPAHTGFVWARNPTAGSGVSSSFLAPVTRLSP